MKGKLCSPWSFGERVEKRAPINISPCSKSCLFHFISLSSSLLGNELHSSGSFILTPFIMFVLCLLVVTLSYATISVVPGRASVFKCWVLGFCMWWGGVCFKPIVQESSLLKWEPFRWDSSQLSSYWPKSNPSFVGGRVAFVLAVPCDQTEWLHSHGLASVFGSFARSLFLQPLMRVSVCPVSM